MSDTYYDNTKVGIFIQPYGPNTKWEYLGCHELADITEPKGDIASAMCADPHHEGKFNEFGVRQGAPGRVTFTLRFPLGRTQQWLEKIARRQCELPVYVHWFCRAPYDVFDAFERGKLIKALITEIATGPVRQGVVEGGATGEMTYKSFNFSGAVYAPEYFVLDIEKKDSGVTVPIRDIVFCSEDACPGACGPADFLCEDGYAAPTTGGSASAAATPIETGDYGDTWAPVTLAPFPDGIDVAALVCFWINATTKRLLAAAGTTDGAEPMQVAYSDDGGTTWVNIDVAAAPLGEFCPAKGLFALSMRHIWLVTDDGTGTSGNIYFSDDGGTTWTLQLTGATDALNHVDFLNENLGLAVGDTNEIWATEDGGVHWTAVGGPAALAGDDLLSCVVVTRYRWFITADRASGAPGLWYTEDGGATWASRVLPTIPAEDAAGPLNDIDDIDEYNIWATGDVACGASDYGVVYRSINGGYSWTAYAAPLACAGLGEGYMSIYPCDYNQAFSAGCVDSAGDGAIAEVAM